MRKIKMAIPLTDDIDVLVAIDKAERKLVEKFVGGYHTYTFSDAGYELANAIAKKEPEAAGKSSPIHPAQDALNAILGCETSEEVLFWLKAHFPYYIASALECGEIGSFVGGLVLKLQDEFPNSALHAIETEPFGIEAPGG
jgi:hypothetical protein